MEVFPEDQILRLDAYRPAPLKRYRFVDISTTKTTRQVATPETTKPASKLSIAPIWAEAFFVIGIVVLVSEPWRSEMQFFKVVFPIVAGLIGLMLADANINKRRSLFNARCKSSRERMYISIQEQALQS